MVAHGQPTAPPARFNRTDAGNGEAFAARYGETVRYDHRRRRWLLWDRHWWREDTTGRVRQLAKAIARARYFAAPELAEPGERKGESHFALDSENRRRQEALLVAAQTEAPIADMGDAWDLDPWLLGVANGVVDLRTGELRPGEPSDQITLRTEIAYDPEALCPRWLQFLAEVFSDDTELIGFIGRAVGYSLTGLTIEQCLFLCHGTGPNGKSVFLTILRALVGEYAANTPFATLEAQARERHLAQAVRSNYNRVVV